MNRGMQPQDAVNQAFKSMASEKSQIAERNRLLKEEEKEAEKAEMKAHKEADALTQTGNILDNKNFSKREKVLK